MKRIARSTLAAARLALVQRVVKAEVTRYLFAELHVSFKRACANCGRPFHPRSRWHFLCGDECRREWGRGLFRPRD